MQKSDKLDTFVIVKGGTIVSPTLTTTRQYGIWLQNAFGQDVGVQELFLKTRNGDISLLESHPGTRIGNYFDTNQFTKYSLKCWYIDSNSDVMTKLIKLGLADKGDCSKYQGNQMLRVYTVDQIELYLQTKLDKNFKIGGLLHEPKQVVTTNIASIIQPAKERKKGLF